MLTLPKLLAAVALGVFALSPSFTQAQQPTDPHHPPGATPTQPSPGGMMMSPGMMGGRGMMSMMGDCPMMGGGASMYAEGRVAFLWAEIGITEAQKVAWESYAAALKKNLASMQGMGPNMMRAMQTKSPVEKLDAHLAMMEGRVAALKEIKAPLVALYAALTPEQKQKADQLLTSMGCMM